MGSSTPPTECSRLRHRRAGIPCERRGWSSSLPHAMSEAGSRVATGIEAAVVGVALALAVVGLALLPLLTPIAVRTLVTAVGAERLTGLSSGSTLGAADSVRRFVIDPHAPDLPGELEGRPAFD